MGGGKAKKTRNKMKVVVDDILIEILKGKKEIVKLFEKVKMKNYLSRRSMKQKFSQVKSVKIKIL